MNTTAATVNGTTTCAQSGTAHAFGAVTRNAFHLVDRCVYCHEVRLRMAGGVL